MVQICENIKAARVSANKTQAEMANLLGVKRTTYANWEGNTEPDFTTLKAISQILGVPLGDIIGEGKDQKNLMEEPVANYPSSSNESAVYKIAESNYILAKVQQDAIATAKDAVAAANKIADGNLVLIEANNRMASLLMDLQKKVLTESDLQESLTGANATLQVLRELILADGVGKHWKSVDEGVAKLNKQIAAVVQNSKATGTRDGAHI